MAPSWAVECLTPSGQATIDAVPSPVSLALSDGRVLRLSDVRAADPAAMQAALAQHVGETVDVFEATAGARDRWGRAVGDVVPHADVVAKDTTAGLTAAMLARGLALVDPADMSGACLAELFGVERMAEAEGRGVWRTAIVVPAATLDVRALLGRYVIVDGTVVSVGATRQTTYLNFGSEWRTDFTALIRRRDGVTNDFAARDLSGRRVRVRGVLEAWNGGVIAIEHPAQVELR